MGGLHLGIKIAFVALAAATAVLFWRAALADNLAPKRFGVVVPGKVFRSGALTPAALDAVLRDHGIKTVVDLGGFEPNSKDDLAQARTAATRGVERVQFRLKGDGTGDPDQYARALRIIADPARQPVLVHCAAGTQRTGACVMLYRLFFENIPFEQSLAEAQQYGHDPADNPKLLPYLRQNAEGIRAKVLPPVPAP